MLNREEREAFIDEAKVVNDILGRIEVSALLSENRVRAWLFRPIHKIGNYLQLRAPLTTQQQR